MSPSVKVFRTHVKKMTAYGLIVIGQEGAVLN